jgi:hypothetical protein
MGVTVQHAVITIGKALDPASKERFGRPGKMVLDVLVVKALFDDWMRLDKKVRDAEELRQQLRQKEEND